tara:strand:- start:1290 stop:2318 length:1029 start_codon:yes stop_codon:yes gene_type:complete
MEKLKIYNTHCCGEIGDVVVGGKIDIKGNSILEQSQYLFKNKKIRNFLLNEPRGAFFKHFNIIVPPKNKKAKAGFIILEAEDNPPMSGSNSICVATVLLEKNILQMSEPVTEFFLEAPGGIIKVKATCKNQLVENIEIENLPSYVYKKNFIISVDQIGQLNVSIVFGGDTFVICNSEDLNLKIEPKFAKDFVNVSKKILKAVNEQVEYQHPTIQNLDFISFCQFTEPVIINDRGVKEGKNTVCIRPGKLDRSACGTGTSARLALLRANDEIKPNEVFISKSIINSVFESKILKEYSEGGIDYIKPSIKGSAFITGYQEIYVSDKDPFPEGYKLNDTWPDVTF